MIVPVNHGIIACEEAKGIVVSAIKIWKGIRSTVSYSLIPFSHWRKAKRGRDYNLFKIRQLQQKNVTEVAKLCQMKFEV